MARAIPPTLTIEETMDVFRANNVSLGQGTFAEGIKQGVFPFASIIPSPSGKRDTYYIWSRLLDDWMRAHLPENQYINVATVVLPAEDT